MSSKDFSPLHPFAYLKAFSATDLSSTLSYDLTEILKLSKTHSLQAIKSILSIPPKERTPQLINIVTSYTSNLTFFKKLIEEQSEEAHIACCQQMSCEVFQRKEFVFRQGEHGTKFYIILEGTVGVILTTADETGRLEDKKVVQFYAGDSFGERAIVLGQNRTASIKCKQDCVFAVLDYYNFKKLLDKTIEQRFNSKVDLLKGISIFKGVPRHFLYKLTYYLEENRYKKKQFLFNEGDGPIHMYILKSGEIKLTKALKLYYSAEDLSSTQKFSSKGSRTLAGKSQVAIIGANELFGEEEIFSRQPREFSAECLSTYVDVFVLSYDNFILTLSSHKSVFKSLKQQIKLKKNIRNAQIMSYVTTQTDNKFSNPAEHSTEEIKKAPVVNESPTRNVYKQAMVKPTKDLFRWPNTNKNKYAIKMIRTELKRRTTVCSDISIETSSPSPGSKKFRYTQYSRDSQPKRPTPVPSRENLRRKTVSEKSFKLFNTTSSLQKQQISISGTPVNIHIAALKSKKSNASPEIKGSGPKYMPIFHVFNSKENPNHLSIRNLEVYEDMSLSEARSVKEQYLQTRSKRVASSKHSLFRLRLKV